MPPTMPAEQKYEMPYTQAKYSASSAAAAIVMAANYHNIDADHDTVVQHLGIKENTPAGKENIKAVLGLAGFKIKEFYQHGRSDEKKNDEKSSAEKSSSIDQLLKHIDEKKSIIANLSYGIGEGHYVVVHSKDDKNIIYHDPEKGPNQKMSYAEFDKKWESPDGQWKKWYVVVDKPEEPKEHKIHPSDKSAGSTNITDTDNSESKRKDRKQKPGRKHAETEPDFEEMPEFV